jgi:hypothetical protein
MRRHTVARGSRGFAPGGQAARPPEGSGALEGGRPRPPRRPDRCISFQGGADGWGQPPLPGEANSQKFFAFVIRPSPKKVWGFTPEPRQLAKAPAVEIGRPPKSLLPGGRETPRAA